MTANKYMQELPESVQQMVGTVCSVKRRSILAARVPIRVKAGRGGQHNFRRCPDHAP
jgi:hypothetical protein